MEAYSASIEMLQCGNFKVIYIQWNLVIKKMIEKSSEDMDAKEHHTAIKLQDITFASSNIAFLKSTVLMW